MKYEIILFDVDDTLFDFSVSQKNALHNTFTAFGMPTGFADYEAKYKEISKVLWGDLEQGLTTLSALGVERFRRLFLEFELEINADKFSSAYLENLGKQAQLMQGAVELCGNLAECRLAVITNGYANVQRARIGSSPLRNTFEQLIISEEAGFQKPDARIFDYAFSKLQITDKEKVLIVGDSLTSDIQGGLNYGIDTCWYNPLRKENHTAIMPTYEIYKLNDILKVIE